MADSPSIVAKQPGKRARIKDQLRQWIHEQGLEAGDRLLPQTQLAEMFETTEVTMHRVLTELSEQGVVHRIKGKGTFINAAEAQRGTGTICFVLPGPNLDKPAVNPQAWSMVQSLIRCFVEYTADGQTFTVQPVTPEDDYEEMAEAVEQYSAVFFHFCQEPRAFVDLLIERGRVPVICMGRPHPDMPCLTIDHDRYSGARRCVGHLTDMGYRRIGLITVPESSGQVMTAGYAVGVEEAGLPFDDAMVQRCGARSTPEARLIEAAERLLDQDCDAILADTDLRGLSVCRHLRSKGLNVPGEVGVMGYDGLDWAMYHPPYLTTLEVPWVSLIDAAMALVHDQPGRRSPHQHIEQVGEVFHGETTAPRG